MSFIQLEADTFTISSLKKNRNLPHRLAETDRRALCPRRVPGKQRGGHQRAAHHRQPEGEQAAVLPEPVAPGRPRPPPPPPTPPHLGRFVIEIHGVGVLLSAKYKRECALLLSSVESVVSC